MALEKSYAYISVPLTADGQTNGYITVGNAYGFYVKQRVNLTSNTQPNLSLEVKRVSQTQIGLGLPGDINSFFNVSNYLVADDAIITAHEQSKSQIKPDLIFNAVYERDPAVAFRTLLVDKFGVPFDSKLAEDGTNQLEVSAEITVAPGTIPTDWTEIDLSYNSNDDLTGVQFLKGATVERTLTLSYDSDDNLTKVVAS